MSSLPPAIQVYLVWFEQDGEKRLASVCHGTASVESHRRVAEVVGAEITVEPVISRRMEHETGVLSTVCAWCKNQNGTVLSVTARPGGDEKSHGMCAACEKAAKEETRKIGRPA